MARSVGDAKSRFFRHNFSCNPSRFEAAPRQSASEHNRSAKLFVLLKVIPAPVLAQVRPPLALALVIDTSGSMRGGPRGASKLEQAMAATDAILGDARLLESDLVSLIQFDDVARVIWPLAPLGNRQNARAALKKLAAYSGGTKAAQGLLVARQELARIAQGGVAQRVLLLTDGRRSTPKNAARRRINWRI